MSPRLNAGPLGFGAVLLATVACVAVTAGILGQNWLNDRVELTAQVGGSYDCDASGRYCRCNLEALITEVKSDLRRQLDQEGFVWSEDQIQSYADNFARTEPTKYCCATTQNNFLKAEKAALEACNEAGVGLDVDSCPAAEDARRQKENFDYEFITYGCNVSGPPSDTCKAWMEQSGEQNGFTMTGPNCPLVTCTSCNEEVDGIILLERARSSSSSSSTSNSRASRSDASASFSRPYSQTLKCYSCSVGGGTEPYQFTGNVPTACPEGFSYEPLTCGSSSSSSDSSSSSFSSSSRSFSFGFGPGIIAGLLRPEQPCCVKEAPLAGRAIRCEILFPHVCENLGGEARWFDPPEAQIAAANDNLAGSTAPQSVAQCKVDCAWCGDGELQQGEEFDHGDPNTDDPFAIAVGPREGVEHPVAGLVNVPLSVANAREEQPRGEPDDNDLVGFVDAWLPILKHPETKGAQCAETECLKLFRQNSTNGRLNMGAQGLGVPDDNKPDNKLFMCYAVYENCAEAFLKQPCDKNLDGVVRANEKCAVPRDSAKCKPDEKNKYPNIPECWPRINWPELVKCGFMPGRNQTGDVDKFSQPVQVIPPKIENAPGQPAAPAAVPGMINLEPVDPAPVVADLLSSSATPMDSPVSPLVAQLQLLAQNQNNNQNNNNNNNNDPQAQAQAQAAQAQAAQAQAELARQELLIQAEERRAAQEAYEAELERRRQKDEQSKQDFQAANPGLLCAKIQEKCSERGFLDTNGDGVRNSGGNPPDRAGSVFIEGYVSNALKGKVLIAAQANLESIQDPPGTKVVIKELVGVPVPIGGGGEVTKYPCFDSSLCKSKECTKTVAGVKVLCKPNVQVGGGITDCLELEVVTVERLEGVEVADGDPFADGGNVQVKVLVKEHHYKSIGVCSSREETVLDPICCDGAAICRPNGCWIPAPKKPKKPNGSNRMPPQNPPAQKPPEMPNVPGGGNAAANAGNRGGANAGNPGGNNDGDNNGDGGDTGNTGTTSGTGGSSRSTSSRSSSSRSSRSSSTSSKGQYECPPDACNIDNDSVPGPDGVRFCATDPDGPTTCVNTGKFPCIACQKPGSSSNRSSVRSSSVRSSSTSSRTSSTSSRSSSTSSRSSSSSSRSSSSSSRSSSSSSRSSSSSSRSSSTRSSSVRSSSVRSSSVRSSSNRSSSRRIIVDPPRSSSARSSSIRSSSSSSRSSSSSSRSSSSSSRSSSSSSRSSSSSSRSSSSSSRSSSSSSRSSSSSIRSSSSSIRSSSTSSRSSSTSSRSSSLRACFNNFDCGNCEQCSNGICRDDPSCDDDNECDSNFDCGTCEQCSNNRCVDIANCGTIAGTNSTFTSFDGTNFTFSGTIGTTSSTPNTPPVSICGNGVRERGEICDDGNQIDADECTNNCRRPPDSECTSAAQCESRICRDNLCAPCSLDEECPADHRCVAGNCVIAPPFCGNGRLEAGEQCDDGNANDNDVCSNDCLLGTNQRCTYDYQCDTGRCVNGICSRCTTDDQCPASLACIDGECLRVMDVAYTPNFCGNAILEPGEACDLGPENSDAPNAACRPDCSRGRCGDSVLDRPLEACDDGNTAPGDGCNGLCQVEPGAQPGTNPDTLAQIPFQPGSQTAGQTGGSPIDNVIRPKPPLSGGQLSEEGPATVAVMAAGAAAGYAFVRRRFGKRK